MTNRLSAPRTVISSARGVLMGRLPHRAQSKRDGFALVAVIWSLGLITLLGMAVMVGARYRTRVSSNYVSVVAAGTAAESAINLGLLTVLAEPSVKFPLQCRMPGGEHVLLTVEEEAGKIDLNTASLATLTRFFTALTRNEALGKRIAGRIVEDRVSKSKEKKSGLENGPPFATIMQLDQIDGISPQLFRTALRLVTVRSGRPEPDMDAASPVLRRLLNIEQKPTSPARGLPAAGSITIRADVRAPDGSRFIREALVSLAEGGRPYLVREWRHGDIDSTTLNPSLSGDNNQALGRSCFRTVATVAG